MGMLVTFLLDILLLLALIKPTESADKVEYKVIPMEADWASAVDTCLPSQHLLMPDLGKEFFQSEISQHMETGEVFWMNAKSVEIMYTDQPVYLKFAYQSEDTKLLSYLCHKASTRETKNNISNVPLSYQDAEKLCRRISKWTLYSVSSPKQAKMTVSLLRKNTDLWVNKTSRQKIPNMVSDELHMKEDCLGVIKLEDGTLDYRRDNCTSKHKFVCVSSPGKYAPTLTKMTEPYLFVFEEPQVETENSTLNSSSSIGAEDSGMNAVVLGGSIGGSLVGIILIILFSIVVYVLHKRRRSRKDYLRSLQRYTQRQSGSRRLHSNTGTGSLPFGTRCDNNQEPRIMTDPEEYEECEKPSYAQCQKDVVQDLKSRYTRYPSSGHAKNSSFGASTGQANYPSYGASTRQTNYSSYGASTGQTNYPSYGAYEANHPSQGINAELEKLPAYHSMDGTLQVLPAYEKYDPDIGHLQHVCGYVNKNDHPQLSQLDQYDNVPTLPKKTGKQSALDDLDQYENHSPGNQKTVNGSMDSKPLDGTVRSTVSSLDDLEKYENYNLPKRKIGMFQMLKASKAKQAAKEAKSKVEPNSLNDLENYEKYEPPSVPQKKDHELENLDAYENYTLKK